MPGAAEVCSRPAKICEQPCARSVAGDQRACYINGGFWSERAAAEASKYCNVDKVSGTERDDQGYLRYPDSSSWCALAEHASCVQGFGSHLSQVTPVQTTPVTCNGSADRPSA